MLRPLPHLAALNPEDHDQGSTVLSLCSSDYCDQHPSPPMSFSPAAGEQPTAKAPPLFTFSSRSRLSLAFVPWFLTAVGELCHPRREPELLTMPTTSPEFALHRQ
jgi:hypothetical protein